jgi:hypothetical protein
LRDCLCVCYRYQIPAWRHDDEGISAELVEDAMFVGPSPVWDGESAGLVSAIYYGILISLAVRVCDDILCPGGPGAG